MESGLGKRIENMRLNKGMNKTEFGRLFGASGSLVNKWENHNIVPSEERLKQIAKIGDISVSDLLYGTIKTQVWSILNQYDHENKLKWNGQARRKVVEELEILGLNSVSDEEIIKRYNENRVTNTVDAGSIKFEHSMPKLIDTEEREDESIRYEYEFQLEIEMLDSERNPLKEELLIDYKGTVKLFVFIGKDEKRFIFQGLRMLHGEPYANKYLDYNQVEDIKKNLLLSVLENDFEELATDIGYFEDAQ